jgi:hypothetical protein
MIQPRYHLSYQTITGQSFRDVPISDFWTASKRLVFQTYEDENGRKMGGELITHNLTYWRVDVIEGL